jgi:DNA-binding transcriptional MerR regulator
MDDTRTYTLEELAALVELPRRTVRYYIQIGLVDRPDGVAKGAYYGRRHLEQLLAVRKWQLAGLSLERIGELLATPANAPALKTPRRAGTVEVWSHLVVADGIELVLEPGRAGLRPEQVRAFFRDVQAAYTTLMAKENKQR